MFLTYALLPVIDLQREHLHLPRWVAFATTLVLGIILLGAAALVITSAIRQFAQSSPLYLEQLEELHQSAVATLPVDALGVDAQGLEASALAGAEQYLVGLLGSLLDSLVQAVSNGAMVIIFMLFLLVGKSKGPSTATPQRGILGEIERSIGRYAVAKILISIATGLLNGLVLMALGVPFALVFGVLAFLLNFIPNLGPLAATLLPLPVVLLNPELTPVVKVLAIVLPGIVQTVSGNVVEPKIMGDSLDLHPITVLIALVFFGMLWGIAGMFLATPISAVVKILFAKVEVTRPLSDLMAGKLGALTREGSPPRGVPLHRADPSSRQPPR
ncbi:MAG: AI-2E family transporter [Polyangiaceae bacterium]|nr:AI-2E family transporter [Polyangiaceae bacterium]